MCKPMVTNTFTTDVTLSLPLSLILSHSVARLVDCDCFSINRLKSTYIDYVHWSLFNAICVVAG